MPEQHARATLAHLWSPVLAITTIHEEHVNGQIAVAGVSGSILPEAPRVVVELWKANYTHDLVVASRVFALHLLPSAPDDALRRSIELIRALGFRSGRGTDKLAGIGWRPGSTGCPILGDALSYVEARVIGTLDGGDMTIFLGEVVAAGHLRESDPVQWHDARQHMPAEWLAEYEANQERQRSEARRRLTL